MMFGENWTEGTPDGSRPWQPRPRPAVIRPRSHRVYRRPENAPRGRMSAYAFFIQTCREEHKQNHPGENIVFKEFSRQCADRWKTLSEAEKQHFTDMAAQDRARYAKELETYQGPRIRNRRRKTRKDPRAPKRALSAFFWFCSEERPKLRAQNPNASVGKIAKELGYMWANADQSVKDKYNDMAVKDKIRYEQEMEEYKKGNFIREVEGMEDLPPLDPANNGKIPNVVKKYTPYTPPTFVDYIGHTIGVGSGEATGVPGPGTSQHHPTNDTSNVNPRGYDDDDDDDDDDMVSDEEMDDAGSCIEDDMPL